MKKLFPFLFQSVFTHRETHKISKHLELLLTFIGVVTVLIHSYFDICFNHLNHICFGLLILFEVKEKQLQWACSEKHI